MSQPLLQLKDVVAFYGDFQALFGVSFEVRPNEVLAILGGNGAGKTTCLRVVSGLLRPRSGTWAIPRSTMLSGAEPRADVRALSPPRGAEAAARGHALRR